MARKVFFSFHYADIFRVSVVRNSWRIAPHHESQQFFDKAEWEKLKRTNPSGISRWIDQQLAGSSVTVVLIGQGTAYRKWVKYEIQESISKGNGLIYSFNICPNFCLVGDSSASLLSAKVDF